MEALQKCHKCQKTHERSSDISEMQGLGRERVALHERLCNLPASGLNAWQVGCVGSERLCICHVVHT